MCLSELREFIQVWEFCGKVCNGFFSYMLRVHKSNVNDEFLNGSWMYLLDLLGSSIASHHTSRAGDELSYTPLGKHLNDMAVQFILRPSCLPKEITVGKESAKISVGITL